jgi:hypothetical protein
MDKPAVGTVVDTAGKVVEGWAFYVSGTNDAYIVVKDGDGDMQPVGWTGYSLIKFADYSELAGSFSSLTTRISGEELTRESADTSLATRLSSEESARAAADSSLVVYVDAEISAVESAVLSADLSIVALLSAETSNRAAADISLDSKVSAETSTRISADASLATADSSLTSRLAAEESTRDAGDVSLTTRLSSEEVARASADTSLVAVLSVEASTRLSADSAEASSRVAADSSLTTRIATEESTRLSVDLSLAERISVEESVRNSADKAIQTAQKERVLLARVGFGGFGAVSALDKLALDTVAGTILKTSDFAFGADVVNLNLGEGVFSGKAAFSSNFNIYINGVLLRPVIDAGKIKVFTGAGAISFAGLNGDYVFHKDGVNFAIAFPFALIANDEIQVKYFNNN